MLDVERMVAKNTMPQTQDQGGGTNLENHPVIRTLYDHMEVQQTLKLHVTPWRRFKLFHKIIIELDFLHFGTRGKVGDAACLSKNLK